MDQLRRYSIGLLLFGLTQTSPLNVADDDTFCRCFPGDSCWPSTAEWIAFNHTVGGKLIATTPIAAPCHHDDFETYDADKCAALRTSWFSPTTHLESASSIMAPYFVAESCNPFLRPDAPCTYGNYVRYTVNATERSDFQATIQFVRKHNIRLVIKNTGHDYNGKSSAAGALALWTHHLKSMEVIPEYSTVGSAGRAVKLGAGVEVHEVNEFADANGLVVVGGNCGTVGLAGGYTQGGGHGPLASKYGLAADQVLEWEVVTGTGELVTATPYNEYSDLYWALCGGGGGTFGAVLSLTAKAYASMKVSAANLTFAKTDHNADAFWDVVGTFQAAMPGLVDAGAVAIWFITPESFTLFPVTAVGLNKADLDQLLDPVLQKLEEYDIDYTYFSKEFPTYLRSYNAMNAPWEVGQYQLAGRLIPRSLVERDNAGLTAAARKILDSGNVLSGVAFNVSRSVSSPDAVAANPYWRESIFSFVFGAPFSYTDWEINEARLSKMVNEVLPYLEALTPDGGAYLNEATFRQPDWKDVFYGSHYEALLKVKAKYDPESIFYTVTGVGSDSWYEGENGRLCKV